MNKVYDTTCKKCHRNGWGSWSQCSGCGEWHYACLKCGEVGGATTGDTRLIVQRIRWTDSGYVKEV